MMHAKNINSGIKQSVYVSISLACFGFVFWQSVQCIEKYIENPQGTKLRLQRTSELHQFPAITICPFQKYDEDNLKKCGLRYDKLFVLQVKNYFKPFFKILVRMITNLEGWLVMELLIKIVPTQKYYLNQ